VRGKELLAAAYAISKRADARELRVSAVTAAGEVRLLASLAQQRDDSLASDLAPALVAWDEALGAAGASPRGVVRVADLLNDHAGPPRDVSPAESDAEMPRLVPLGSGQLVLWLSRRPETGPHPTNQGDAAATVEAVGEARAFTWVEAISLDASGAPVGGVRRLTPVSGHVSSFDAMPVAAAGEREAPAALVVARDDGESVDGSGGALLRVRVGADGADPPLALPGDGLGRGAPSLLDADDPQGPLQGRREWLAWTDPREELRLLPLDASGAPLGPPSAEAALGEGRPLLPMPGARVLVALAGGGPRDHDAGQLRAFACALP
jgi:hypothetical protein